jgi:hypothetical protein
MENMGKQKIIDKTIGPAEIARALQTGGMTTAQAQAMFSGVLPIGDYKGRAAILDIDKLVIQPLILAEKQWTLDRVDPRNGHCVVNVPIGTSVGGVVTAEIEVPTSEVWYLAEHEIEIPETAAFADANISVNFLVSSFPPLATAPKLYYDATDPQVYLTTPTAGVPGTVIGGSLVATAAEIAAGDIRDHRLFPIGHTASVPDFADIRRNFCDGDELKTELRLVGGDTLTLVVTVLTAPTAGAILPVHLRVWGRVGKRLVI